ncbi:SH3 domain-containing protein [Streptomyces sp. NPDC059894]|uniref:SH3 domain-containing protein n=1 Tax=unclassified Streptomyces TaxID=2593676 RepID=UPI003648EC6D
MKALFLTRSAAAVALGLTVAAGATIKAPDAHAATLPKSCTWTWSWPQTTEASTAARLRTGPGTTYTVLGILYKGNDFTEYCNKNFKWSYGKVTSGPNKGKWGWVSYAYLKLV